MNNETTPPTDQSHLQVVYVLLLLQGAMGLLSGAAMLLFMGGSPAAFPVALGAPILLFVVAAGVTRGNRWARRVAMAMEAIVVFAFAASFLLGLMRQVDMSLSVMTVISNVALPLSVVTLLRRPVRAPMRATAPAAHFELDTERSLRTWAP